MGTDDHVVQVALGFERSFSLLQLADAAGVARLDAERVVARLVRNGDLSSYKTDQGQTRYQWS